MSSLNLSLPTATKPPTKKRKRSKAPQRNRGVDFDRALDEGDDVSDNELIAAGPSRRKIDDDYDEDEDEDEDDAEEGEEEEEEDEEEEEEDDQDEEDEDESGDSGLEEEAGAGTNAGGRRGKQNGRDQIRKSESGEARHQAIGLKKGVDLGRRNKKMRGEQLMLRSMMDPEQARRFDAFSSVVIPKGPITKLNKDLFDQKLQGNLSAVLAGMAKILITEVVELAKELQPHSAMPSGRLRPYHLRLAREELERRGVLSGTRRNGGTGTALRPYKPLFRR